MDPRLKKLDVQADYRIIIADAAFTRRLRKWIEQADGYMEDRIAFALQQEGAVLYNKDGSEFSTVPDKIQ